MRRGLDQEPGLAGGKAAVLLARAARLMVIFHRLFWTAAAGLAVTLAAVACGDWEAHPGRWVGLAALGQIWLLGASLLAFRVYALAEALERAARAAGAEGVSSSCSTEARG